MNPGRFVVQLGLCSFFVALFLTACGRESIQAKAPPVAAKYSSPIVGGTQDTGHPAVALVYNNVEGYVCTGTLIDDQVLLTAGHCVEDTNPAHYEVGGGVDPFNGAEWVVGATEIAAHPDYSTTEIGVHDVGIIVLDDIPPVTPLKWQEIVTNSVYSVGTPFMAVGYGITSGSANDEGVKRKVSLTITERYQDGFQYGGSSKNTCSGDSGGPGIATISGVETVIGVVSFGDQNCAQYGFDMRTDYNATFIKSFAGAGNGGQATPTPGPSPTGTPGNGGDDDDGSGNGSDPTGKKNVGCSVTGFDAPPLPGALNRRAGWLAIAALGFVTLRRRR